MSKLLGVALAGLMVAASPASAKTRHHFQIKNCDPYADMWSYWVYNADDGVEMVPYMKINFSSVGEVKDGECEGAGKGYCKVMNANVQRYQWHVHSAKTIYGDAGYLRTYDGIFDCDNEPAN